MSVKSPFKNSHDRVMPLPDGTKLRVQVKKFQHVPRMSQETTCFTADLWLNGRKVAYLQNNGRGEGSHARPYEGGRDALRFFERLVETLPDVTIPATEYGAAFTVKSDMEHWIDEVVGDMIQDAQARKLCKQGTTYVIHPADDSLRTLRAPYTPELAARLRKEFPDCVIYNEHLPKPKGYK